jgi:O-acetyl-ADP-ribose deacetylase (regulator of RNase III)/uncharacterized protein YwgA
MIKLLTGNLINSSANCLVNTVNCEGFMGKGIAYQFKQVFPLNEKYYSSICKMGNMKIGNILAYEENNKLILNFPTKNKWREKSEYSYIEKGLIELKKIIKEKSIKSIAIPPLGCGNGGLEWDKVKKMIFQYLTDLDIEVFLYEPSKSFSKKELSLPKLSASHIILMRLKSKLTKFNKIRLQKACFFINIFSGNEYFKFEEYKYGPYSHSIEILAQQIKDFQTIYSVTTIDAENIALNSLISDSVISTINNYSLSIDKASHFINEIDRDHDLEIISTIVYIIKKYPCSNAEQIVDYFFAWPKHEINRFKHDEVFKFLNLLVDSTLISKVLIGYSINLTNDFNKLRFQSIR